MVIFNGERESKSLKKIIKKHHFYTNTNTNIFISAFKHLHNVYSLQ